MSRASYISLKIVYIANVKAIFNRKLDFEIAFAYIDYDYVGDGGLSCLSGLVWT